MNSTKDGFTALSAANEVVGINRVTNVLWSAQAGTYYSAIRDLAYIAAKESREDRPGNSVQWGIYLALVELVKVNMPGLVLDTSLKADGQTAELVAYKLVSLCRKNPRSEA